MEPPCHKGHANERGFEPDQSWTKAVDQQGTNLPFYANINKQISMLQRWLPNKR
jgi:hypothetical protein